MIKWSYTIIWQVRELKLKIQNLGFKRCLLNYLDQKFKFDRKKWAQFKFKKINFLNF